MSICTSCAQLSDGAPPISSSLALAVMKAEEFERFFPRGAGLGALAVRHVSAESARELAERCRSLKPRVLLSSWSTPQIEPVVFSQAGGSVDYVCNITGSVRHVVTREMIANGVLVSNWGKLIAPQVAEHALLLILGLLRSVRLWDGLMRTGALERRPELDTRSLFGKSVGIHGFGEIARRLIALLAPFSVKVEAYSEGVPESYIRGFGASVAPDLETLARGKDVFVCCEALTERTKGSVGRRVLAALPDGAAFCNIARGALVDEEALLELSRAKGLRVASDVFSSEPQGKLDSPLLGCRAALLSPHIGGPTQDFYPACGDYALANVMRFLRGEEPESRVTLEVFDRST